MNKSLKLTLKKFRMHFKYSFFIANHSKVKVQYQEELNSIS